MGKIKRAVLENFKTIEKLSLLKINLKSFFFSVWEFSFPSKRIHNMFSPLSLKSKVKNRFFILFENKRKNKIKIYLKKQKTFSLIVIMFFSIKTKIKVFVLWEKNGSYIHSFIYNLTRENQSVKQPIRILRYFKK